MTESMSTKVATELYKGEMGSEFHDVITSTMDYNEWLKHPMAQIINNSTYGIIEVDLGENGYSLKFVGNALEIALAERYIHNYATVYGVQFFEQEDESKITIEPIIIYVKEILSLYINEMQ